MLRLVLVLCCGLFAAMLIAGRDHGQVRFGLVSAAQSDPAPRPVAAFAPIIKAAPTPETVAVRADPVPSETAQITPDAPVEVTQVAATSSDQAEAAPAGKPMKINASSLKVRVKPGKDFTVIARLRRGALVQLIQNDAENEGWSLISIGDSGLQGYVQTKYLHE
jgi:hypothetical protein